MKTVARTLMALLLLALTLGGQALAASPEADAKQLTQEGTTAYRAGDYAKALERFRAARAASAEAGQLFVIGRCLEELGQLDDAAASYEAYLAEDLKPDERALAERRLNDVRQRQKLSRASLVVWRTPDSARVLVQGQRQKDVNPVRLELKPGRYRVQIAADGFEPYDREVDLGGGVTREVNVTLEAVAVPEPPDDPVIDAPPVVEPEGRSDVLGYSLLGAGSAVVLAGVGLAVASASIHVDSDALDTNGDGISDSVSQRDASSSTDLGNALGVAAWVSLGVGAGLAATGTILLLLPDESAPPLEGALVAPVPGGLVLGYDGRF